MLSVLALLALSQATPSWKDIDRLVEDQKLEAAAQATKARLTAARAAKDDDELARALVRHAVLRLQLGDGNALGVLRDEPWPTRAVPRSIVATFYAVALEQYLAMNAWELSRREKVETKGPLDLQRMSADQLREEIDRAWAGPWESRDALGAVPLASLSEFFTANDFPPGVRDSLRDFVTLQRARALGSSDAWIEKDRNELYRVPVDSLLGTAAPQGTHPLVRAVALLDDLEAWHGKAGRKEGALFARTERLRMVHAAYSDAAPRAKVVAALLARVTADSALPLSAWVRARVANWLRYDDQQRQARDIAAEGARAHPATLGGQSCRALVAELEAPAFQLDAPLSDGPRKRSLTVSAKNLPRLYFRAFKLDASVLGRSWDVLPDDERLRAALAKTPVARWSVDLPATPDLQLHATHVTPPLDAPGAYLVAASALESFQAQKNQIVGAFFVVSDLVMTVTQLGANGALEATVRDGSSGAPAPGVEVTLYGAQDGKARRVITAGRTDAQGLVRLTGPADTDDTHFLLARKGAHLAVDPRGRSFWGRERDRARDSAIIYTDRAIYRPAQTIRWKVVAWHAAAGSDELKVVPNTAVKVVLNDGNGQQVAALTVRTNEFGSASGEFPIPAGRILGAWHLWARGSTATVRVEEYKRPTFEVTFKDTGAAMKLNAPVSLKGEARYYFGLPVTAGKVRWRVHREPVFPWWFRWWAPPARSQVIATGEGALRSDGTFSLDFTPEADPSQPRDVTWSFRAEADVTEDGGETRSASQHRRLGVVSVQASFDEGAGFLREQSPAAVTIRRTNLDGEGRAGTGRWRLVALQQPSAPVPWAEELRPRSPFEKPRAFSTPGDAMRSRASATADVAATLRSWADGKQVATGEVTHDASGEAAAKLPALPAGAYRLRYETKDEAGARLEIATELVVSGATTFPLAVPAWLKAEAPTSRVGTTARFLVGSGFPGQHLLFEVIRDGKVIERRWLVAGRDPAVVERATKPEDRGGYGVRVTAVHDWALASFTETVDVPWNDKALTVEFSTLRDTLRPGTKEQFRVTVKGQGQRLEPRAAEVLASMYDKSLDVFAPFSPPRVAWLYPVRNPTLDLSSSLTGFGTHDLSMERWFELPREAFFKEDAIGVFGLGLGLSGVGFGGGGYGHGIGDLGTSGGGRLQQKRFNTIQVIRGNGESTREPSAAPAQPPARAEKPAPTTPPAAEPQVRSNFAETAFFAPHLVLGEQGEVAFEVPAPDSVTAWNLWVEAITRDLRGGSASATARTVKDLMVRPALPRFLREGDQAALKVVVNNASTKDLAGDVRITLFDPATNRDVAAEFGVKDVPRPFSVKAGQSVTLTVPLSAPRRVGDVAVKVVAKAGDLSDGELRAIPLLPSRLRLEQSRFVTLKDQAPRTLSFEALVKEADPTRIDEQLVVTVDAQLFSSVLSALPYLVRYPYECTEQTMNRFLSTGIVASVFRDHPSVAKLSKALASRKTPYEPFDAIDPNRKAGLEETPWLTESKGGSGDGLELVAMLDPAAVQVEQRAALKKLEKLQLPDGSFPWFPGGLSSPGMTLYLLQGFARAAEFKLDVPRDTVTRAWRAMGTWYRAELTRCLPKDECGLHDVTMLAHAASAYPDDSWLGGALSPAERTALLDYSFRHWKEQPPYLKGLLALALKRAGRAADAKRVFDSVMDAAKTTPDEGTFWQPSDRSWLWYHDTVEGHAFALRALMELSPKDPRREGLVQWLLLNKKLNHWKSTRASAEAIYALVKYLQAEKSLGLREETTVTVGAVTKQFVFAPDDAAGRKQQLVLEGNALDAKSMATVTVSKATKGLQFASATWHFSTDRLPEKGAGDLFQVTRTYFKRVKQGPQVTLQPLAEGARLEPGDELEVQLVLRAKQAAEYVHLRDPRGAGFEPDVGVSRYRYELGLFWYEELRDSGTNFFFESVPAGEYTLKYRVRAAMGGAFRVGPATLQSMYAPEFTAYSAGHVLTVGTGGR